MELARRSWKTEHINIYLYQRQHNVKLIRCYDDTFIFRTIITRCIANTEDDMENLIISLHPFYLVQYGAK